VKYSCNLRARRSGTYNARAAGPRGLQHRNSREELHWRSRSCLNPQPRTMQVEEQKRRAEADKLAAITALEQRSREFMREKEAKARLEARIASMQSQLLVGGAALEETPVFRRAALFTRSNC